MSLLPLDFVKSVVLIKGSAGTGTAFIYAPEVKIEWEKRYRYFLVTNSHLTKGVQRLSVKLNTKDKKLLEVPLPEGTRWFSPKNGIDLSITLLNPHFLNENGFDFMAISEECAITEKEDFSKKMQVGQDIFLVWFPLGIEGIQQNYPIVRQGIIARNDEELLTEGCFFLDANNFPGNSWGPIFSKPSAISLVGKEPINESLLIGIVFAYKPFERVYYDNLQTPPRPMIITQENSGIALAVPSYILHQLTEEAIGELLSKEPEKEKAVELKR